LDSKADIYIGEVGATDWKTNFPDEEMPAVVRATRCLQKLERMLQKSSCSGFVSRDSVKAWESVYHSPETA
jgi:hypothetical protein